MRRFLRLDLIGALPWLFLVGALAVSLHFSRVGWDNPLLDSWGFRETQTAITVRSFVEHGIRLDYETPVLGAPWSIPFEFPTYQICVALLTRTTGMAMEPAGRLVSLLFAYGTFALLGVLVARMTASRAAGLYSAGLALVSPIYLYGSRAFMIESTALFFTLGLLLAVHEFATRPRWAPLVWATLFGAIAAVTKITTFAIGLVGVAGLLALHAGTWWRRIRSGPDGWRLAAGLAAALVLPVVAGGGWTHYTDVVKSRNELAAFLTSAELSSWNFGTWAQRIDLKTWNTLLEKVSGMVLGMPLVWLVATAMLAASGARRAASLIFAAMFAAGFVAFTNLYMVHAYYHYANGLFLLAVFGIGLGALWDRGGAVVRAVTGLLAAPLLGGLMLWGYVENTLPGQITYSRELPELAGWIKSHTPAKSAILVYGLDWDSSLAYYAHRSAIMVRGAAADDRVLQRAVDRLDRPLSAVVFVGASRQLGGFVPARLAALGFGKEKDFDCTMGDVYLAGSVPVDRPNQPADARLRNFGNMPVYVESAPVVEPTEFYGHPGTLVHAPGLVSMSRPKELQRLEFNFGIKDGAYQGGNRTDGVKFVVDFVDSKNRISRLFERRLDPVSVQADRGLQSAIVHLPPNRAGRLLFRTEPGASGNAFDWSVWQNVRLN